jgi:hypothetical protein
LERIEDLFDGVQRMDGWTGQVDSGQADRRTGGQVDRWTALPIARRVGNSGFEKPL